jgi:hypothetical protein
MLDYIICMLQHVATHRDLLGLAVVPLSFFNNFNYLFSLIFFLTWLATNISVEYYSDIVL